MHVQALENLTRSQHQQLHRHNLERFQSSRIQNNIVKSVQSKSVVLRAVECAKTGGPLTMKEKRTRGQLDRTRARIRLLMDQAKSQRLIGAHHNARGVTRAAS